MVVWDVDGRRHRRFASDDPVCRLASEVDRSSRDRADRLRLVEADVEGHDVGIPENWRYSQIQSNVSVFKVGGVDRRIRAGVLDERADEGDVVPYENSRSAAILGQNLRRK